MALCLSLSLTIYLLWALRATRTAAAKNAERLLVVESRLRDRGLATGNGVDGGGKGGGGDRVEGSERVASRVDLWREAAAIEVTDVEIRLDSVGSPGRSASLSLSGVDLCSDEGAESGEGSGAQGEAPPMQAVSGR